MLSGRLVCPVIAFPLEQGSRNAQESVLVCKRFNAGCVGFDLGKAPVKVLDLERAVDVRFLFVARLARRPASTGLRR